MFNLFNLTWNDFCWHDWEGVSCGTTWVVGTIVVVILIAIIAKVILRLTGRPWPWWLPATTPEETPTRLPVWQAILIVVGFLLVILIGGLRQGGRHPYP